jgi:hypothetical protein
MVCLLKMYLKYVFFVELLIKLVYNRHSYVPVGCTLVNLPIYGGNIENLGFRLVLSFSFGIGVVNNGVSILKPLVYSCGNSLLRSKK